MEVCNNGFCIHLYAHRRLRSVLAMCWICGLLLGVAPYFFFSQEALSLMHRTVFCSASIVGLLNAALLPFLLSAVFAAFSIPWAIGGICFVKAFLFSYVSMGSLISYYSGGWLLRYFLLFCGSTALPLLYWYWLRTVSMPVGIRWLMITGAVFAALVFVTVLDYRVIAPFVCLIDSMKG